MTIMWENQILSNIISYIVFLLTSYKCQYYITSSPRYKADVERRYASRDDFCHFSHLISQAVHRINELVGSMLISEFIIIALILTICEW